ncbi:hypothetical protein FN976_13595 [Caenimonas sedimenti]|uniref:DUF3616 domain-containing protein n=1 Tax=Caenimonas sedimenti TaxID=2596921 RepID=A0A562ZPS8_9BURK|nr:hypothetical protein [Caenimonas sedimenti]TWO70592.1 hypothetical protein FN976_13595 [Caenimonas sedimenti]
MTAAGELLTEPLRELRVSPALHPRGQRHLSSASGLVLAGGWLYLVADDEHHLGALPLAHAGDDHPVALHRLRPGELPGDKEARKKHKPDCEALLALPPWSGHPQGALLALGSGSRPNREQGFLLPLRPDGSLADAPVEPVDLHGLYAPLRSRFPDLNIEGAFASGDRICLLQRANQGDARNACASYAWPDVRDWLDGRRAAPAAIDVTLYELGTVAGVPYGFTDGAALPGGGWIFSAAAEDTEDSYRDGLCAGSALGWVRDGRLTRLAPLAGGPKVEGIAVAGHRLLLVTDADDPESASRLLALPLP